VEDPAAVRFTTIQKFRGMERRVVIVTELDKEVQNIQQLNYLGCSRAKSLLNIFLADNIEKSLLQEMLTHHEAEPIVAE
jgi:hypothetical protein